MNTTAKMSLLRDEFTRQCNSATPSIDSATGNATPAQQPPAKPASLLDLARDRLRNSHATPSEKMRNTLRNTHHIKQGIAQHPQETAISNWLTSIGETDLASIDEVLTACRTSPEALAYFTSRAKETPQLDYTLADITELDALINQVCDLHKHTEDTRQRMLDVRRTMPPMLIHEQLQHFRNLLTERK
jgi:hypothetical protein